LNRRQSIIITVGVTIIVGICIYCLMEYDRIDKSYPKGTYKFQETTKTKNIKELFFILGVYVIIVSIGTGSFVYVARSKSDEKNTSDIEIAKKIEVDLNDFKGIPHTAEDVEMKMRHLTNLRDKSLITEEEYNKLVNQIFEEV